MYERLHRISSSVFGKDSAVSFNFVADSSLIEAATGSQECHWSNGFAWETCLRSKPPFRKNRRLPYKILKIFQDQSNARPKSLSCYEVGFRMKSWTEQKKKEEKKRLFIVCLVKVTEKKNSSSIVWQAVVTTALFISLIESFLMVIMFGL